ncbi:MAG: hypothetical protein V1705_00780 [bacterium]
MEEALVTGVNALVIAWGVEAINMYKPGRVPGDPGILTNRGDFLGIVRQREARQFPDQYWEWKVDCNPYGVHLLPDSALTPIVYLSEEEAALSPREAFWGRLPEIVIRLLAIQIKLVRAISSCGPLGLAQK